MTKSQTADLLLPKPKKSKGYTVTENEDATSIEIDP